LPDQYVALIRLWLFANNVDLHKLVAKVMADCAHLENRTPIAGIDV
jgi:hypothetical protein